MTKEEIEQTDRWMAEQFQKHDYREMYEIWNKFKVKALIHQEKLKEVKPFIYQEEDLKAFKIETFDGGGYFNFLTSAVDSKDALHQMQANSTDFKNIVRKDQDLTIKVTECVEFKETKE